MLLYMYIAQGQGQTTPWGQMLTSTGSPYHFAHLLQVLKQSLWSLILYTFFHVFPHVYIAPGRGRQHIGDKILMTTERPFLFAHYVASFKMITSKSDFIHILNDLIHVYSPGARAYNPLGTNFWCQQKALFTLPIRCKFKKKKSDFTHIFNDFIYVYSPGGRQPLGDKFFMSTESPYHLPICCRFKKKMFWSPTLYTFFSCFTIMYIPGQGQTIHWGQNFDDNRKAFSLCPYVEVSKWSLRNLILYTFSMILYMYIAPGQGQKNPWGQTFDVIRKPLSLRPFVASFKQISLNSDFIHIF